MSTPPRPADDPLAPQAMASQQPREVSTPSTLFTTDELLARVRRMIEDERAKNPQAPEQQLDSPNTAAMHSFLKLCLRRDLGIMHGTPLSNSNMVELPADQLPASPPASPLPNVDAEVVLSQSDLDTVDILKELLMDTGAPEEEDEAEAEHAPREVREAKRAEASQREAFDILEASQADFIEQHAENPPQQLQPRAHVDVAYEVEEEEEHLFSIPQMDGSADEVKSSFLIPRVADASFRWQRRAQVLERGNTVLSFLDPQLQHRHLLLFLRRKRSRKHPKRRRKRRPLIRRNPKERRRLKTSLHHR